MTDTGQRKRRPPTPGEFEDPLSIYDPPEYADGLEKALCESPVKDLEITPYTVYSSDITVEQATTVMREKDFYCLMIADEEGKLLGVFTERDVLKRVAEKYVDVKDQPVGEFMTTNPQVVYDSEPISKAMNLMAVGGFRHVPVLNVEDKVVGIVGPNRVAKFIFEHFNDRT